MAIIIFSIKLMVIIVLFSRIEAARKINSNKYMFVPWSLEGVREQDSTVCWDSMSVITKKSSLIDNLTLKRDADGLKVKIDPIKNRTVYTTRSFSKGEYICEYVGDKLTQEELNLRERNNLTMEYTFAIQIDGSPYIIDASKESGRLCRLLNHSLAKPNAFLALVLFNEQIRVIYVAKQKIKKDEEIMFSYQSDVAVIKDFVEKNPSRSWLWN